MGASVRLYCTVGDTSSRIGPKLLAVAHAAFGREVDDNWVRDTRPTAEHAHAGQDDDFAAAR